MTLRPPPFWPSRDPDAQVPINFFFAIVPPAEMKNYIYSLAGGLRYVHGLNGKLIAPGHLHSTLFPVGSGRLSSKELGQRVLEAASRVRLEKFEVVFDRTQSLYLTGGKHPFVLAGSDGEGGLRQLHRALGSELVRVGLGECVRRQFEPHITMFWADRCVAEYPVDPVRWTVGEFVLVLSLVGRTRHIHLRRWLLTG